MERQNITVVGVLGRDCSAHATEEAERERERERER
jgi:hypothetical protein